MCHHNYGSACFVDLCKQTHNLNFSFIIKISCRFICKDKIRIIYQSSRDGCSFKLSSGELCRITVNFI